MYIKKRFYAFIVFGLVGAVIIACAGLLDCLVLKREACPSLVVNSLLLSAVLGTVFYFSKAIPKKPLEEISALVRTHAGKPVHSSQVDGDEIAVALGGVMEDLQGLLQSVKYKIQSINSSMETLNTGLHQVVSEQNNLFTLGVTIEAARTNAKQDGFSTVSDDIFLLADRNMQLTRDMREMSAQLRNVMDEVVSELEQIHNRVSIKDKADAPIASTEVVP
ncbi:MAG: methyl-accepting chemotaxis protein [Azoarcus sp.]|jgi:methyl-accepting chemotaxis protein|nr:methyl-accepting chemotaxis protein [Azoarcus sp.]